MPIEVINLSHSYKEGTPFEKQVLFDINLSIGAGEFVGIIGPTRSGKTTLAQHFNALHIPRQGKVLINGLDTKDKQADLVSIRHRVGYVFQNPDYQLFAPTVAEDVAFGPLNMKLPREEIDDRVRKAMAQVGLDYKTLYNRDIFALSGGQKRRAAIAGVLACKPQVLVLDDVTAGLDPRGREEILALIRELHRRQNITIIFISNSMDEAASMAERIIVINEGRVIMDDSTREVFARIEDLRSIGLQLPEVTVLIDKLRSAGFNLPAGALNVNEAIRVITAALREMEASK